MKMAYPENCSKKLGVTYLSTYSENGNVYVVDQNGDLVNGVISNTIETSVDSGTVITLTAYSYEEKPQNQPDE